MENGKKVDEEWSEYYQIKISRAQGAMLSLISESHYISSIQLQALIASKGRSILGMGSMLQTLRRTGLIRSVKNTLGDRSGHMHIRMGTRLLEPEFTKTEAVHKRKWHLKTYQPPNKQLKLPLETPKLPTKGEEIISTLRKACQESLGLLRDLQLHINLVDANLEGLEDYFESQKHDTEVGRAIELLRRIGTLK